MMYIQINIHMHILLTYGSNEISIAPNNTVVLLNINKTQYSNQYSDKETMRSKYLL